MMKLVTTILFVFLIVPANGSETVKGAKKDLDKFKQEMSVELQEIEKKLDVMSKQAKQKRDATYDKTVQDLTETRDKVRSDLYDLEADAKGKWKTAKSEMAAAINKLNSKVQQALKD